LLRKEKKAFSPAQREAMERVVNEDIATKTARVGGDLFGNQLALGGAGATALYGTGNPVMGAAAMGGMGLLGRGLKEVSQGGTKEAMDDLLRAMAKVKKYPGLLSPEGAAMITKGARQLGLEYADDPAYDY